MLAAKVERAARPSKRLRRLRYAVAVLVLQGLAGVFFMMDAMADVELAPNGTMSGLSRLESVVALALIAGIAMGAGLTRQLFLEARERERVIAMAQGALAGVIADRFAGWKLSAAESDVALFALKGFSISEIATLRGSAEGTVRAQLSQVYAKADVSSQSMLMALFIEELMTG